MKIELSLRDLDAILAYKIDTNKCFSLLKTLRLLDRLNCSFSDIARGREIYLMLKKGEVKHD